MTEGPADSLGDATIVAIAASDCRCVAFSPDGSALALVAGGRLTFLEYPDRPVWSVPCELDPARPADVVWGFGSERLYVLGNGMILGYGFESGGEVASPDWLTGYGAMSAITASPDGRFVVAGTMTGPVLALDDLTRAPLVLRGTDPATALCWRPDGSELCVARADTLEFWDVADQAMLASVHLPEARVDRLAWSPDGGLLAAAGQSGVHQIRVGALSDLVTTAYWPAITGPPVSVQFCRDGRRLLIGVRDDSVVAVSRTLRPLDTIPADIAYPSTLAISSTGLLAIRTSRVTVGLVELPDTLPGHGRTGEAGRRWAARHGRTVGRRRPATSGYVTGPLRPAVLPATHPVAAFAWWPDGRSACLATADGMLARIRPPSVQHVWQLAIPRVSHIAISHDGLIAATSQDGVIVLNSEGNLVATLAGTGPLAWSPPGTAEPALAVIEPPADPAGRQRPAPRRVLILRPRTGDQPVQRLPMPDGVNGLSWSPAGPLLAVAGRGHVVLWDTRTGRRDPAPLPAGSSDRLTGPLAWSADGRRLAAVARGDRRARVLVWNTANWQVIKELPVASRPDEPPLTWSPDSRVLAIATSAPGGASAAVRDQVELWDVLTGQRLTALSRPDMARVTALSWSPDGDTIAAAYADGTEVLWDVVGTALPDAGDIAELAFDREVLVRLACAAADAGAAVPLESLAGLLALVGGDPPEELMVLAAHRGVAALRALGWPLDARVGLATLLAADLRRDPVYLAPADATRDHLAMALRQVLVGPACPVSHAPIPVVELTGVLNGVTDRLMTLLDLLGPDAVAAEPSLPARLRHLRDELTPLTASQRRMLGMRVPLAGEGGSEGGAGGQGRAGVARHGNIGALLLSQLALPPLVFAIRHARDELLYRTRSGSPPPAPRAAVLVLDDTAAAHGRVGVTLRLIAHLIAVTVIHQGYRCALVTLGAPATEAMLTRPEDLIRIWTAGTDMPPDADAGSRLARGLVPQLGTVHGGDTRVILLTHPYQPPLAYPGSITVRVHYPGGPVADDDPLCVVVPPEPTATELIGAVSRLIS
ncbi:MAG: WD40 repeat domain-containing protein [Streptosporangiaceae bacterium]|nr:WD40 repeat domain-containing protein [Streptosporangiaceae bacterium]